MVSAHDHLLVDTQAMLDKRLNDAADARDLAHRGGGDLVVLARVDVESNALLNARDGDPRGLRGGAFSLDMLADPNIPVDAENNVDLVRVVGGGAGGAGVDVHGEGLAAGAHDAAAAAGAADGDEEAVAQLAVLEGARVQHGAAVAVELLDLGDEQLALGEEGADLQLVRLGAPPLDAAGQVDGGEGQLREQGGADVDAPPPRLHLGDAADDEVADLGRVARAQGAHGEELVRLG